MDRGLLEYCSLYCDQCERTILIRVWIPFLGMHFGKQHTVLSDMEDGTLQLGNHSALQTLFENLSLQHHPIACFHATAVHTCSPDLTKQHTLIFQNMLCHQLAASTSYAGWGF